MGFIDAFKKAALEQPQFAISASYALGTDTHRP